MTTSTETEVRLCIHCGGRQRIEETLQRDFDGVLDERVRLQGAMGRALTELDRGAPHRAAFELREALDALAVVVENHPGPTSRQGIPFADPATYSFEGWPDDPTSSDSGSDDG